MRAGAEHESGMTAVRSSQEIRSLTGLRGIAALWVFAYHLAPTVQAMFPDAPMTPFKNGFLGVDVFFVLSGFVLALNYGGRVRSGAQYRVFMRNRLVRIYPLHAVITAGLLVLVGVVGIRPNNAYLYTFDYHVALHMLLIHAWGFEEGLRWNGPSWSISAEFFAYLLFPVHWWIASRFRGRWLLGALIALVLVVMVVLLRELGHETLHVASQHSLIRVSAEFLAGCLTYRLYATRSQSRDPVAPYASAILLGVFLLGLTTFADPIMPFAACLMIYALAVESGAVARFLGGPVMVWLGTISYSIYMVHLTLLAAARKIMPLHADVDPIVALSSLAALLVVVLLASAATYRFIEEPARRRLRRRAP